MNHYGLEDCPGPLFAPRAPSVRGSATSAAAADSLGGATLNRLHRLVLEYLRDHGPATDEEIAAGLAMNPSTARPRRIELVRRGMVVEAGTRKTASKRNASVWQVTAASR
jgi:predicted ArsR family transcriptional regulator